MKKQRNGVLLTKKEAEDLRYITLIYKGRELMENNDGRLYEMANTLYNNLWLATH